MRNGIKYNWTALLLLTKGMSKAFQMSALGFTVEERTVKTMEIPDKEWSFDPAADCFGRPCPRIRCWRGSYELQAYESGHWTLFCDYDNVVDEGEAGDLETAKRRVTEAYERRISKEEKSMEHKIELPKIEDLKWTPGGVLIIFSERGQMSASEVAQTASALKALPNGPALVLMLPHGTELASLTPDQFEQIRKAQVKTGPMCAKCDALGKPQRLCDGYEPSKGFVKDGYCPIHGFITDWTGEAAPSGTFDSAKFIDGVKKAADEVFVQVAREQITPEQFVAALHAPLPVPEMGRTPKPELPKGAIGKTASGAIVYDGMTADDRATVLFRGIDPQTTLAVIHHLGTSEAYFVDRRCMKCGDEFGDRHIGSLVTLRRGEVMRIQCVDCTRQVGSTV